MKVWQVDPLCLTPYYDQALCGALAAQGHDVRWIHSPSVYETGLPMPEGWRDEMLYAAGHPSAPRRYRRGLRALLYPWGHLRLLRALDADAPDVVHIQWCRAAPLDAWLIAQIQRRRVAVVHTIHDVDPLFGFRFESALEQIYAQVDRLVVHTHANRERLLDRMPHLAGKVTVVPHIAAPAPLRRNASREAARHALGIPETAPVVLFFGTMRSYKGLDVLIEVIAEVHTRRQDVVFLIAGHGVGSVAHQFVYPVDRRVIVHDAYVPLNDVWRYQLAADLAVFPYRRVSQSGALITAMSFGLPAIVTNVGGLPETVDGNGWIVPVNDASALTAAILEAVEDRARLEYMGHRSLEILRRTHAPERVAEATTAVYLDANRSRRAAFGTSV